VGKVFLGDDEIELGDDSKTVFLHTVITEVLGQRPQVQRSNIENVEIFSAGRWIPVYSQDKSFTMRMPIDLRNQGIRINLRATGVRAPRRVLVGMMVPGETEAEGLESTKLLLYENLDRFKSLTERDSLKDYEFTFAVTGNQGVVSSDVFEILKARYAKSFDLIRISDASETGSASSDLDRFLQEARRRSADGLFLDVGQELHSSDGCRS
jgi:hypothetical protein